MREDELASRIIRSFKSSYPDTTIHPEAPYNHYGDRGVVDLHVIAKPPEDDIFNHVEQVIEIKSDAAIENVTGANEILRQFNRARKYFYHDESNQPNVRQDQVIFELAFTPVDVCLQHVIENFDLYASVDNSNSHAHTYDANVFTIVTIHPPDPDDHSIVVNNKKGIGELIEGAEKSNVELAERIDAVRD